MNSGYQHSSRFNPLSWRYIFHLSGREIGLLCLANLGINLLSLAVPLFIMQIYDRIIPHPNSKSLVWLASGVVTAVGLESILRYTRDYLNQWVATRFEYALFHQTYDSILHADIDRFQRDNTTVHLDRVQAIQVLKNGYFLHIFEVLLGMPLVAVFISFLYYLNPKIAYFVIMVNLFMLLIIFVIKIFYERTKNLQDDSQNERSFVALNIFQKMHVVKAFALEEPLLAQYESIQFKHNYNNLRFGMLNHISNIFHTVFPQITQFGIIALGSLEVYRGTMTMGLMIASMIVGSRTVGPVTQLCTFLLKRSEVKAARRKLEEIQALHTDEESQGIPAPSHIAGHLRLINVGFKYEDADEPVLENINLNIRAGSTIGFRLSEGGDYSTLLKLLSGRIRPTIGKILIDDYDFNRINPNDLLGIVEYLSKDHKLLSGNILDNLSGFDPHLQAASIEASAMLRVDERIAKLDHGFTSQIESSSNLTFPLSLLKTIALIKALAARPRILLIDEFDKRLDLETLTMFQETLKQLKFLCTIIVVSGKEDVIAAASEVYELKNKTLVKVNRFRAKNIFGNNGDSAA